MPGPNVPFPPMEAHLVRELPRGEEWQYEPKWDGFRGVLENDGGELALWSRKARPLLRYFPELRPLGELMPPHSALDGEIVITRDGIIEFDSMQMRLHPAESRIRKLSAEIPAQFIAFDLLLWDGEEIWRQPLDERRARLEAAGRRHSASRRTRWTPRRPRPGSTTSRRSVSTAWSPSGADCGYRPAHARRVAKLKAYRTADCVVVGLRWKAEHGGPARDPPARAVRGRGRAALRGLGCGRGEQARRDLGSRHSPHREALRPRASRSRTAGARASSRRRRYGPELVAEVRYDKVQGHRLRHGTKLLRFRDDKAPGDCTWRELRPPRDPNELTVDRLLHDRPTGRRSASATTALDELALHRRAAGDRRPSAR